MHASSTTPPYIGQVCVWYGVNPIYGTVSFDDIGSAWLTIFQCITLEGWHTPPARHIIPSIPL